LYFTRLSMYIFTTSIVSIWKKLINLFGKQWVFRSKQVYPLNNIICFVRYFFGILNIYLTNVVGISGLAQTIIYFLWVRENLKFSKWGQSSAKQFGIPTPNGNNITNQLYRTTPTRYWCNINVKLCSSVPCFSCVLLDYNYGFTV